MSEPNDLRAKADHARDLIARLKAELEDTQDDKARKALRLRIKSARMLEKWFRSRNGYA